MNLHNDGASIFVPDGVDEPDALARTTHLGIGAHPDDLEIITYHGIAACYEEPNQWFAGITCTHGSGSSRAGEFRDTSDAEMRNIRRAEQERAATLGQYAAVAQLDYSSDEINGPGADSLCRDLVELCAVIQPRVVYAHSPADKHRTHISVLLATIAALRQLPAEQRPETVYGCEAWRDLDWLDDDAKVLLDVGDHPELARQLIEVFESQNAGGKRYDIAALGRRAANATFQEPRAADHAEAVWLAMDLSPLVHDESIDVLGFVDALTTRFAESVHQALATRLDDVSWK